MPNDHQSQSFGIIDLVLHQVTTSYLLLFWAATTLCWFAQSDENDYRNTSGLWSYSTCWPVVPSLHLVAAKTNHLHNFKFTLNRNWFNSWINWKEVQIIFFQLRFICIYERLAGVIQPRHSIRNIIQGKRRRKVPKQNGHLKTLFTNLAQDQQGIAFFLQKFQAVPRENFLASHLHEHSCSQNTTLNPCPYIHTLHSQ